MQLMQKCSQAIIWKAAAVLHILSLLLNKTAQTVKENLIILRYRNFVTELCYVQQGEIAFPSHRFIAPFKS